MPNDERMTKPEARNAQHADGGLFVFRHSDFFRISDFGFTRSFVIFQRQFDRKPAPFPNRAPHPHPSSMRLHNMFHDAQPNPHPLRFPPQLRPPPIKPLKFLPLSPRRSPPPVAPAPDPAGGGGRPPAGRTGRPVRRNRLPSRRC